MPDKGKDDNDHQDDQGDKDDEDDTRNIQFPTKNHDKEAGDHLPEKDMEGDNTDVSEPVNDTQLVLVHKKQTGKVNNQILSVNGNNDDVDHVEVKDVKEKEPISPITPVPATAVMVQSNTHTGSNKTDIGQKISKPALKRIPNPALKLIPQTRPRIEVASLTPDQKASVKLVAQRYTSLAEFVPWFPLTKSRECQVQLSTPSSRHGHLCYRNKGTKLAGETNGRPDALTLRVWFLAAP